MIQAVLPDALPNVLPFPEPPNRCHECSKASQCLGLGIDSNSLHSVLDICVCTFVLRKHEKLITDGDRFHNLYAVRSGAVKVYKDTETGEEQIIDFCLPGHLIGLDAIDSGRFQCHAVALDTSSICAVEFSEVERLCEKSPHFRKAFFKRLSAGIHRHETLLVTLGTRDAYQRLAAFLVTLTEYYGSQGLSRVEFVLPMSRADIADYLNLAVETVSRLFSRLQSGNCVQARRNTIRVMNLESLYDAAGMNPPPAAVSARSSRDHATSAFPVTEGIRPSGL